MEMNWISVNDRLPCDFEGCICCDGEIDIYPAIYFGNGEFWIYHEGAYEDMTKISCPTHWMPLPAAPVTE